MRLLTYNIHKGIGGRDRRYRLERIIETIEHENPDLICLQEVDRNVARSKYDDQPQLLARHFNAAAQLYQQNVRRGRGGLWQPAFVALAHDAAPSDLAANAQSQTAWCTMRRDPIARRDIVGCQLALRTGRARAALAGAPLARTSPVSRIQVAAGAIAGDFNDWRNTLAAGPFAKHGFAPIATPPSRFRSFPAYLAIGSLDKAFTRGQLSIGQARIARSAIAARLRITCR